MDGVSVSVYHKRPQPPVHFYSALLGLGHIISTLLYIDSPSSRPGISVLHVLAYQAFNSCTRSFAHNGVLLISFSPRLVHNLVHDLVRNPVRNHGS